MLLALGLAVARGQTLAEYMDAAVANHPRAAIAEANAVTARADVADAGAALLPTVGGRVGAYYNQYETIIEGFPTAAGGPGEDIVITEHEQFQAALDLRVPLLDAPALARWQGLRLATDAVDADQRAVAQDLRLDVARAWYTAIATQELVAAAERAKSAADENVRYLSLRAEVGAETVLSVQRAELESSNAELLLIDARQGFFNARRSLATLSGLPEPQSVPASAAAEADVRWPTEEALQAAAEAQRPELVAAEARVAQLRRGSGAAWLAYAPTVVGVAREQVSNAAGFTGENASWLVGVELDWLLLELGDRPSDVRRARAALDLAEAELRSTQATIRDEVHSAWLDAETAAARVVAARRGADVGRAAATEVLARFQAGTATQVEVIQADRDALNAEVERIRADGQLAVARLALLRAAGDEVRPP